MSRNEKFWNPETFKGDINPFERFDSWRQFLEYYVTPENEIERKYGPGNHIGDGEWYITLLRGEKIEGETQAFLSYVVPKTPTWTNNDNQRIKYIILTPPDGSLKLEGKLNPRYFNTSSYTPYTWEDGSKNNWGGRAYLHYRVDFNKRLGRSFINWTNENPLEEKR